MHQKSSEIDAFIDLILSNVVLFFDFFNCSKYEILQTIVEEKKVMMMIITEMHHQYDGGVNNY